MTEKQFLNEQVFPKIVGQKVVGATHDGYALWLVFANGVTLYVGDSDMKLVGVDPADAPYEPPKHSDVVSLG